MVAFATRDQNHTGIRSTELLPPKDFAQNQVWCEIVALACELLAWTQMLAMAGTARHRPKRLRLRLLEPSPDGCDCCL